MPNPSGTNSFDRFAAEPAYGESLQEDAFRQAAPLAGQAESTAAIQTPRRSKRQAGRQQAAPAQPGTVPQAQATVSGQAEQAAFWQQVARIPGASPLVQQLAAEAQSALG